MAVKSDDFLLEQQATRVISALELCAKVSAFAAITVGLLELTGWALKTPTLRHVPSEQAITGMSFAVAFALSGIGLWLRRTEGTPKRTRHFADGCAIAVLIIGLIVLARCALQRNFNIGELLFLGAAGLSGTPSTALLFVVFGIALLLLDIYKRHVYWPAQILLVAVGMFALTALIGYLFSAIAPKRGGEYAPAILPATVTFVLLSLGALCSRANRGIVRVITADAVGSDVARRLLPAAILVPPLLCMLSYIGYHIKWYDVGFGLALLTTMNSAVLTTVLFRTAGALNRTDTQRQRTENQRNQLNEALQQANAFREKVMDSAVFAVIALDLEGRFTLVNRRMSELTGYSAAALIGQPFTMLSPADSRDAVAESFQRFLQGGAPVYHAEMELTRKDGSIVTIAYGWAALFSEGKIIGMVGTGEDRTERKRLEEQLLEARKLESIGRLAGGVAHDFNNMLTAIFGYAELLEGEVPADSELSTYVRNIQTAAERAAGLTSQLLAFARRQMIAPRVVDLNNLILNLDTMLQRLIGEHIKLVVKPGAGLHTVCIDPNQFEQILINLVVNARDAIPLEGGRITVETDNITLDSEYCHQHEGVKPGEYVMLAVSDTGGGMEEAVRLQIFEPFFTTKEQGRGTGLGLATVYGIVKQAGGHIWLYSELDQGTCFKIYLPRASEPAEGAAPPVLSPAPPRGTETLLVVEDEVAIRTLTTAALRGLGYHILEAADGVAALEISARHPGQIDLLITDVVMPQMSGKELSERLLAVRPALKVLFVSGYTENTIEHDGVLEPGIDFLPKPFSPSALSVRVREVLNSALSPMR